jgi:predicted MPP superfamily phosphohydrolase
MRSPFGVLIFISIMLLLDLYVFQSYKRVVQTPIVKNKQLVHTFYWCVAAISIVVFFTLINTDIHFLGKQTRAYLFAFVFGLIFAKFLASLFFLMDDLRRIIQWILNLLFTKSTQVNNASNDSQGISRSVFMSWLGLAAGSTLFGSLFYGFGNKYRYQIIKQKLSFKNLPSSFKGLKIVHISDIHCGSFLDKRAVERGVNMIMEQNADMVLFTGDLVNDKASEMDDYKELFSKIKAPLGVYSTLGNHDYGDYMQWPNEGISKEENLKRLKQVHSDMGWRLLMNEHVSIERNGEKMALLGVENWSSKGRFPKYGKMELAYKGSESYPFKILMSHDPSHWHAQVRKDYPDVDLTLSGHTHGMQFGVELPGFKWSPIQYIYKEWAGLYEEEVKKLYVNRGFGFLGYPGRVGVLPEITVLELI